MSDSILTRLEALNHNFQTAFGKNALRPPATADDIARLTALAPSPLPEDYLSFLSITNGLEDAHSLNTVDEVIHLASIYGPKADGLIIGDDSGEGSFLLITASGLRLGQVAYFPDERLDWHDRVSTWPSFTEFFLDHYPDESWE